MATTTSILSTRRKPKRRYPPEILTDPEVRALLDACPCTSATGLRNRALLAILYRAGLRISEALDLYPKDVDLDRGAIRVLHGKGDKARVVGVDRGALAILQRWLDVRACCGHGASRPIFCTASGERLSSGYVRRWLPTLGRSAGIEKRVHAHGLRHTHAAQLREEGVDIGIISKQLGHASISTTAHYLDHIAPWAVVDQIAGRVWVPGAFVCSYRRRGSGAPRWYIGRQARRFGEPREDQWEQAGSQASRSAVIAR